MLTFDPPVVPYPAAPWRSRGGAWIGLFMADQPPALPAGLTPVLDPRVVGIALLRYLQGTLQYDELIIGSFVRRGAYLGVYIQQIWVDDLRSLWGGRRIWGLHKELAAFDWQGATVRISDAAGPVVTLSVDPRTALLPRLPLPIPTFGRLDGRWLFTVATARARVGRAGLRLDGWSDRFPYRLGSTPFAAAALKPFRLTVPPPRSLDS